MGRFSDTVGLVAYRSDQWGMLEYPVCWRLATGWLVKLRQIGEEPRAYGEFSKI